MQRHTFLAADLPLLGARRRFAAIPLRKPQWPAWITAQLSRVVSRPGAEPGQGPSPNCACGGRNPDEAVFTVPGKGGLRCRFVLPISRTLLIFAAAALMTIAQRP